MVTSINFGNLSNVGGTNVLTGGQSGIDTAGLIESLTEARRLPAVALEGDIETNLSQITEYGSLKAKLQTLRDKLDALRNPSGFGSSSTNVFASRQAFLTASDGTTAANYLGIVAENGAALNNYTITVDNLAVAERRQSVSFSDRTSSVVDASGDVAGSFSAGTFQINGADVTLDSGDSLNEVAAKINAVKESSNVEATILKVSDSDFRLIIESTETGTANAITITDSGGDPVFPTTSIWDSTVSAENAQITFNGTTISRDGNSFSDVVDGVTFSLFQETPALTTITADIDKDASAVSTGILEFIDAYNDFRLFYGAQNERDANNELLDTAILNDSTLLDNISSNIVNLLATTVGVDNPLDLGDSSAAPADLTDLGITFNDFEGDPDNSLAAVTSILEFDSATFTSRLESHFDEVQELFEFQFTTTNSNLGVTARENFASTEQFTIVIDDTLAPGSEAQLTHIDGYELATPVALNYDTSDPTYTATITGTGSLAGLTFFYTGDGTSTESITQEIASEKAYSLSVDTTAETAQVTAIRGQTLASAISLDYTVSSGNINITGQTDSLLNEIDFLYFGTTDTMDITLGQGIADKLYNTVDQIVDGSNGATQGLIDDEIEALQDSNENLQDSIDRIDAQVERFRDRQLAIFAALEAAIAGANSVLQLLDAQASAREN